MKGPLLLLTAMLLIAGCSRNNNDAIGLQPSVTTAPVSGIGSMEATCGGNISSAGAATVIARGIVWSTNANPAIDVNTKTSNGDGTGSFTSAITGLQPNTTYHVRAYATSSVGTAYGADIAFTTTLPAPKLYVCGTEWNTALGKQQCRVWVDGNAGTFWGGNNETFGNSVFVSDPGDVYVAGATKVTQWRATYWKNGTPVYLTDENYEAGAGAIFVNGNDVYVCGTERNAAGILVAKYWKNGTAVSLTDGTKDAEARSIQVSGSTVRVVGYEKNASGIKQAKYWNGGTPATLGYGVANSVCVSGNDVHIAGTNNTSSDIGWYWKNGTPTDLNTCYGANKVMISGNDVYVAGFDQGYNAAYWKNGTVVSLINGASANSIFVYDNNVYVAGKTAANNPCYWMNGQRTRLSASTDWHNNTTDIIYK